MFCIISYIINLVFDDYAFGVSLLGVSRAIVPAHG
jgi:hypothetical protein